MQRSTTAIVPRILINIQQGDKKNLSSPDTQKAVTRTLMNSVTHTHIFQQISTNVNFVQERNIFPVFDSKESELLHVICL